MTAVCAVFSSCCVSPVYEFNIRVALHQYEAAPVPQQRCEGRVGDTTLNGAVASIVSSCVQVFGDRPGGTTVLVLNEVVTDRNKQSQTNMADNKAKHQEFVKYGATSTQPLSCLLSLSFQKSLLLS